MKLVLNGECIADLTKYELTNLNSGGGHYKYYGIENDYHIFKDSLGIIRIKSFDIINKELFNLNIGDKYYLKYNY